MAASREEVFERVKEVLTEQLGIEEAEIAKRVVYHWDGPGAQARGSTSTSHGQRFPRRAARPASKSCPGMRAFPWSVSAGRIIRNAWTCWQWMLSAATQFRSIS